MQAECTRLTRDFTRSSKLSASVVHAWRPQLSLSRELNVTNKVRYIPNQSAGLRRNIFTCNSARTSCSSSAIHDSTLESSCWLARRGRGVIPQTVDLGSSIVVIPAVFDPKILKGPLKKMICAAQIRNAFRIRDPFESPRCQYYFHICGGLCLLGFNSHFLDYPSCTCEQRIRFVHKFGRKPSFPRSAGSPSQDN